MKRKFIVFFIFLLSIYIFLPNFTVFAQENQYILGGIPAGFTMSEYGAKVISTCEVVTENGLVSPAKDAGIIENDTITAINNNNINSGKELTNEIKGKSEVYISVRRNDEFLTKKVKVVKDINGIYKIGVFIKESPSGIGTITYFSNGYFASLGHPILDDNKDIMQISKGEVFNAQITNCNKGKIGEAGGLRGIIYCNEKIGNIEKNTTCGVFGKIDENYKIKNSIKIDIGTAQMGDAFIYTTQNGITPSKYQIQIVKTDGLFANEKNLVIKITDEKLLEKSGGIVQGMSGSPIVQNGKLVGAVTHVFINDPTRGYGIKIQDMINN